MSNSYYQNVLDEHGLKLPRRFVTAVQLIFLVAALVGVAVSGAWTTLWLVPVIGVLSVICNYAKTFYWRGFDPFIDRAADSGRFARVVFWNGLTLVLDWILCAIPGILGARLLLAVMADTALVPLLGWALLWLCICPPFMPLKASAGPGLDTLFWAQKIVPLVLMALSPFRAVTMSLVVPLYAIIGLVSIVWSGIRQFPNWRVRFMRRREAAQSGSPLPPTSPERSRAWFPREGVIFEPQFDGTYGLASLSDFMEVRKMLTVLRVNWLGCVTSLAMLIAGATLACVHASSQWLLLVPLCALFGLAIGLRLSKDDRKGGDRSCRFLQMLLMVVPEGILTLWLGGHDTSLLIAAGMLMASSFFFFTGFIVRGTSEGVFDTLDFYSVLLGVVAMIAARQGLSAVGWEALLPLVVSAGAPGCIRVHWPRRDLPFVPTQELPQLELKKRERRARKRERQLAAFRRSQRRG